MARLNHGDEVVFLGNSKNSWHKVRDYGMLNEGDAYIVAMSTPYQVALVGVSGLFDKNLFEQI
jgi:hypothetical protein